jgi:hypothetical protein
MSKEKQAVKKEPSTYTIENCTFSGTPADGTVECATLIAQAALENAKALQAVAAMLTVKGPLVTFGS